MNSASRVVVITGAASGIGLALVHDCMRKGFSVVMADKANTLEALAVFLRKKYHSGLFAVSADVTQAEDMKRLASETKKHFGRVDWLFNNAGISGQMAPVWELEIQTIQKVIDVNLMGIIHGIHAFLPWMFSQSHRSHIINMASFYGLCSGSLMSAYAMSKHAVLALSESLYFDLRRLDKPVDVSVICPSFASTALLSAEENRGPFQHMLNDLMSRSRPPEEVSSHILQEVERNVFYILPDKEVKDYCEQRTEAIITQTEPHTHSMEKIVAALCRRAKMQSSP